MTNPYTLSAPELAALLSGERPFIPELEPYRANPAALADRPGMKLELAQTAGLLSGIDAIPQTRYTHYRYFQRNGDRKTFETPYFNKRRNMGALALRVFLGDLQWKDLLQDYIWDICEETTWVLPAHENRSIDLFSAETGFDLASLLHLLGRTLDGEVRARVRGEVERRIFQPYLAHHESLWWYKGGNNWNGVCNSSVASTFLLLDPEPDRAAQAVAIALAGLDYFLDHAFEKDGTSTEGVGYWAYGTLNFVALSELMRARSGGAVDLLSDERLGRIAAYPARLLLSGSMFAAFSDCDEIEEFNPGIITRMAERTGESSLYDLLAKPVSFQGDWRLTMMLRNALWWDGQQKEAAEIGDTMLTGGGVARLVSPLDCCEHPLVVAVKAGHNAENHNQNDVGSFVVHVDGENLLTDPGRGLYDRFYFGPGRYENIFANSYGHSVPRFVASAPPCGASASAPPRASSIPVRAVSPSQRGGGEAGTLQAAGREFYGELVSFDPASRQAVVDFPRAYPLPNLVGLRRKIQVAAHSPKRGTLWLEDAFRFSDNPLAVEEAFVTWCEVELHDGGAFVKGQRHILKLTIEQPVGASFAVEALEEQSRANDKPGILKRITVTLPAAAETEFRIRMEVL